MRTLKLLVVSLAMLCLAACSQSPSAPSPAAVNAPVPSVSGGVSQVQSAPTSFSATALNNGASTLSWSGFEHGNQAVCTISASPSTSGFPAHVSCSPDSLVVHPLLTTTYTFKDVKNPGEDDNQTASVVVAVAKVPTASLLANPTSIVNGNSSTLSWNTTDGNGCSINQGVGSVSCGGGSVSVHPSVTTTYTLTVIGPGGTVTATATVTVTQPVAQAPVVTLVGSPLTISQGGSSVLTWTANNSPVSCLLNGSPASPCTAGTAIVSPLVTTTYTFGATNTGGTGSASVTIIVLPSGNWSGPTVANAPGTSGFLTANFGSAQISSVRAVSGSLSVVLTWVSNGTHLSYNGNATGGLGSLSVNATSPTLCGGDNNPATTIANTFTATLTVVDATHLTGTYAGVACTIDTGTFSLVKLQ